MTINLYDIFEAEDKSIANKEVKSSNEGVEAVSKQQQQPTNALENLSNALQTIQDLIKTAPNLVAAASSGATDLPNADILSKLSNLFQSASQTNSVASGYLIQPCYYQQFIVF